MTPTPSLAQVAYEAYHEGFPDEQMPPKDWDDLPEVYQDVWQGVVQAVLAGYCDVERCPSVLAPTEVDHE